MLLEASIDACNSCCTMADEKKEQTTLSVPDRTRAFVRAHDLDLSEEDVAKCREAENGDGDEQRTDSVGGDKRNLLLSVNDGSGAVMAALATVGIGEAIDESSRWSAVSATDKILKRRAKLSKQGKGDGGAGAMGPWTNAASGREVLVWYSKCPRPGHGSDYPVVKSRGLIPASARDVLDLIRDSDRVGEYNKYAIGREDRAALTRGPDGAVHRAEGAKCPLLGVTGEAKIMSSRSAPPLTRKPLEFVTLFYARRLVEGDGAGAGGADAYVTVGRSVWETPEGTAGGSDGSVTRCELMLSVNLVREIATEDGEAWCELTCVNHGVSPGIPIFVAKQLAFVAAENYIKDIRTVFENNENKDALKLT